MARKSDGGEGSIIRFYPMSDAIEDGTWSLATYPHPDSARVPAEDVEVAISPERLFWRSTGILAYGAGKPHPVSEEPLLLPWDEMIALPRDESGMERV